MHTPNQQSRKFDSFASTQKKLADSYLQTEFKLNRPSGNTNECPDERGHPRYQIPDHSEADQLNQAEINSSAKKSSGLKCIAKQVIEIIKDQEFMSYP